MMRAPTVKVAVAVEKTARQRARDSIVAAARAFATAGSALTDAMRNEPDFRFAIAPHRREAWRTAHALDKLVRRIDRAVARDDDEREEGGAR